MSLVVKEGNYLSLGTKISRNQITFTFEGEKEDTCRIVLINKVTQEKEFIPVSDDFCMGSLRSVTVSGINPKEYNYMYEINGEEQLDPYATVIVGREKWNDESRKDNKYKLSAGFQTSSFPWGQDKNPEVAKSEMIMYKLHVRGYTMGQKGDGKLKGTFQAVKNKIPYLKDLGITTVELMPVYEFEEMPIPKEVSVPDYVKWKTSDDDIIKPLEIEDELQNINFWGYGEGNYFAVKASYASEPEKASVEFKRLVKALHENGMECVIEMCFPEKTHHNLIMDALHFWVQEYHVDGFHVMGPNIPITSIIQDPVLSRTKIFADDFNGEYAIHRKYQNLYIYKEEYQYATRRLLNDFYGDISDFANQQKKQGDNHGFVNFIASNNGFTLADVFMYNEKHNEANGEDNKDGSDYNLSNNYGVEGPTKRKSVCEIRRNRMRLAFTMLMFAQGVPLIMAGDEFGNTQSGNNNAYCQDNEIGWVNWSHFKKYKEEREFLKALIAFRKEHNIIVKEAPYRFMDYRSMGAPDLSYHGENAWIAQLDPGKKSLGMMYFGAYAKEGASKENIYIAYNFFFDKVKLALPTLANTKWYLDGIELEDQLFVEVPAYSIYVLKGIGSPKPVTKKRKTKKK